MNPALLSYVKDEAPRQPVRRTSRRERRVSRRLDAEAIDRLVAEYVDGSPSAEIGSRYGIDKSSVLRLVRAAGNPVRYPRFSTAETAQLVALYEAGLSQVNIAERLGRSPSAVWYCLQRKAEYANPKGGAIALGHPLGISGARLVLSAAIELSDRGVERAVATMCIGVGQGHLATPAVGLIGIHLAEVSRFWR